MTASFPNIASGILLLVAVLAHFAAEKHSPFFWQTNDQSGWYALKEKYDPESIFMFKLWTGLKWIAIGAAFAIQF
jgi:hypothetical protein